MIIEHILAEKGREVVTIEPHRTLADTAQLLDERRIGAVVVSDADHPVLGIISERDIARAIAQRGAAALNEPVSQHMTAKLSTCTRSCSVSNLMDLMTDRRVRHGPIVEAGQLRGIISIGDVVKHRLAELEAEQQVLHDYSAGTSNPGQRF
jgi:signal-transduction protein with cAMP-binding, CBS, and nucleotidyltransferase domain